MIPPTRPDPTAPPHRWSKTALAYGIGVPVLQMGRVALFGHWPDTLLVWPIALDAHVAGALLLAGAARAARTGDHRLLAAGWAFGVGILYRSTFEQLADPTRHAGHEVLVIAIKIALFAGAIAGLVACVRKPIPSASHPS